MRLPCETVGKRLLPLLRAYIAKELLQEYGLTQTEAARKLGTTQAAISQYLHHKRGLKDLEAFKESSNLIQSIAHEIAREMYLGNVSPDELSLTLCKLCLMIRENRCKTGKAT